MIIVCLVYRLQSRNNIIDTTMDLKKFDKLLPVANLLAGVFCFHMLHFGASAVFNKNILITKLSLNIHDLQFK